MIDAEQESRLIDLPALASRCCAVGFTIFIEERVVTGSELKIKERNERVIPGPDKGEGQ